MANIGGKAIFFAELDDDYQELRSLSRDALLQRTVCYFLLAPSLVVHPAYIWQSKESHHLIHSSAQELLRPPFTQLELGQHDSIDEYMVKRIERLRRSGQSTRELREYETYGSALVAEAKNLSIRFNTAVSRNVSSNKRDLRFRDLLSRDLGATDLDQTSLAAQLGAIVPGKGGGGEGLQLAESMREFVRQNELVSVDTVLASIYNQGFPDIEKSNTLRSRLLSLYYKTYADKDEDTLIPATSKLYLGTVVNPYDDEVFWGVMTQLFGPACLALAAPSGPSMLHVVRAIRESSEWVSFTELYFDTLGAVDQALWSQPDKLVSEVVERGDPGKTRQYVLRKLWQRRKVDLAGAAFGSVALPASAFDTSVAAISAVAGLASLGAVGLSLIHNVHRFIEESGRPGEFHPEAPTERNVTVSGHSALLILSIGTRASIPSARRVLAPL
ncbi:MAG TPA: hypothetical protein VHX38_05100, partial [Pseudonocardiaceae bacterium]|nr:hypothetical protein [Pseudonocardiaceae bacterium]